MILIDTHGQAWERDADGQWKEATSDALFQAGIDHEGYMAGWRHGLLSGLTIGAILLVAFIFFYGARL